MFEMSGNLLIYKDEETKSKFLSFYKKTLAAWPIPYEEFMVQTRCGDTHVIASGSIEKDPIVGSPLGKTRISRERHDQDMKAILLFDTVFGNTERIANSLARGLKDVGVDAECVSINNARVDKLSDYDLLALGAPTQYITASKPMKEFLDQLKDLDLKGHYGFAFDTKLDYIMAGSAAKFIEKKLKASGVDIIRSRSSAIVIARKEKEKIKKEQIKIGEAILKEGMEEQFEAIGKELGELLKRSKARKAEVT
jgi:flavodoxin